MSEIASVRRIYDLFGKVFPRPTSFHNEHCCVQEEHELPLLTVPLHDLTERMLAIPMSHGGQCFGTFEEVGYFVPRVIELLADSDDGFEDGVLDFSFFNMLRDDEQRYRTLGLWNAVEDAIYGIFRSHSSAFRINHFDEDACRQKGWGIPHYDLLPWVDLLDNLLGGFFSPVLSKRPLPAQGGGSEWDSFVIRWADDQDPHRVAHLLDVIRRYCTDELGCGYTLPDSFLCLLSQPEYQSALLVRAGAVLASVESPTWLQEVLCCLDTLVSAE